jgi:hypothetical protein
MPEMRDDNPPSGPGDPSRQAISIAGIRVSPFVPLCGMGFLGQLSYEMIRTPITSLYAKQIGAPTEIIGLLVAAVTITGIFVKFPSGGLANLFGFRRLMQSGLVVKAVKPFLYLVVGSWPPKSSQFIARAKSIAEKRIFSDSYAKRRFIVPMKAFYERDSRRKLHAFGMIDGQLFGVAGIWENWCNENDRWERTFCIITVTPNELATKIHDRCRRSFRSANIAAGWELSPIHEIC